MTIWSMTTSWRRPGIATIALSVLFPPSWTSAAPGTMPASIEAMTAERQIAAYHSSPALPTKGFSNGSPAAPVQEHVAEARRILLELQVFVDKAARTLELGDHLRRQRQENERLRKSLSSNRAAKSAFETHAMPMDAALSALTGTIVRNWLETVRLKYRSHDINRDLLTSEKARLALESQVAKLKRALIERRAELAELRARRSALGIQLGQVRRQITSADEDTRRIEQQRAEIAAAVTTLRRQVTSALRAVLLENDTRATR